MLGGLTTLSRSAMSGCLGECHIPVQGDLDTNISTVQSLPFNTDFDGNAPVRSFFRSELAPSGELTSHFRGRELKGAIVPVPENMVGVVVRKDSSTGYISADLFKEITVWEHDLAPDATCQKLNDLLEFVQISKCVHDD